MNKTPFDNETVATSYDRWYDTPLGQTIDGLEKSHFLKHLKKIPTGSLILELGAGTGHWTEFMAQQGYRIVATDVSKAMLKQAAKKKIAQATFMYADMEKLPFCNQSVEHIVAITSLEFTPQPQQALQECYRVLKKGGVLLVATLNGNGSLQKRRTSNPLFEQAHYFTADTLFSALSRFGEPHVDASVWMPQLDMDSKALLVAEANADKDCLNREGNFLVGSVIKTK